MGLVYADIELANGIDQGRFESEEIPIEQVRKVAVTMLVDSGAYMMAINENTMKLLGLKPQEYRRGRLADGSTVELPVVRPLFVKFKNRTATCSAIVIEGDTEMLLGAIPMEEMDVLIHPLKNELIINPAHPDMPVLSFK
jgi:predicted aspartyl protease